MIFLLSCEYLLSFLLTFSSYFGKNWWDPKGQIISKWFLVSSISSKKWTKEFDFTTMIPQVDLFSFVFWRKSKTPKNHLEIIWPLVYFTKTPNDWWTLNCWNGYWWRVFSPICNGKTKINVFESVLGLKAGEHKRIFKGNLIIWRCHFLLCLFSILLFSAIYQKSRLRHH